MIAIESNRPNSAAGEFESSVSATPNGTSENRAIAALLNEIAVLLAQQGASEFRVRAYQNAGKTLRQLHKPVRDLLENDGVTGLIALPTIGRSIATLIEQYLRMGRVPLLDRLRGEDIPERMFATLPGLGSELSRRIHEDLGIETLSELLAAIKDGRLEKVRGIGRKRVRMLRECVSLRLRHSQSGNVGRMPVETDQSVPVYELLDIDSEYRRLAAAGRLPKIAPRRFNPGAIAWLPILHTQRGERHYTALYSNTARAHELNTTKDWVVIYRDDPQSHGRWTVITSQFGRLRGWRIVRGREDECSAHYLRNRENHPRR
jgi:putative hydrolase